MNVPAEQIEYVVREVMRRLAGNTSASLTTTNTPQTETRIADRVVTVAKLNGIPKDIRKVVVDEKAIVTPAAVDLLKENSIELARRKLNDTNALTTNTNVLLAQHNCIADANVTSVIHRNECKVRCATINSGEQLGKEIRPDEIAIFVSARPFEATCHANRDSRICAVFASNESECVAATNEVVANVLVVDQKRQNEELISTFLKAASRRRD